MVVFFFFACIISVGCFVNFNFFTSKIGDFWKLVINALLCVIISNVLLFIIFRKNIYFKQMLDLIDRITKRKFNRILNIFR